MRGCYTNVAQFSLSAAKTLMYITGPAAENVRVLSARVTNADNETNEQLDVGWRKVSALGTPTATTITPSKHESGDQAAGSTVKANVTAAEPTYGTEVHARRGVPSIPGYRYEPTEREELVIGPAETWGLYNYGAPAAITVNVEVVMREEG
jgi:hypothetical protein